MPLERCAPQGFGVLNEDLSWGGGEEGKGGAMEQQVGFIVFEAAFLSRGVCGSHTLKHDIIGLENIGRPAFAFCFQATSL